MSKIVLAAIAVSMIAVVPAIAAEGATKAGGMKSGAMMKKTPKASSSGTPTATGGPVGGKTNKN